MGIIQYLTKAKPSLKTSLLRSLYIFLFLIIIAGSFFFITYKLHHNHVIDSFKANQQSAMKLQTSNIYHHMSLAYEDVKYLTGLTSFNSLFKSENKLDANSKMLVADDFLRFDKIYKKYDHIRYLDRAGKESIRLNFINGKASITPENRLQDKGDRYYFKASIALPKDKFYVTPIDLSKQNKKIQIPYVPLIRIATPIFDKKENKRGIIIVCYMAKKLLDSFNYIDLNDITNKSYLLNSNGYFIKGPNRDLEWGFMFKDKKNSTFSNYYSKKIWETIMSREDGQLLSKEGLFTFKTVYAAGKNYKPYNYSASKSKTNDSVYSSPHFWKIVTLVPSEIIKNNNKLWLKSAIPITISVIILFLGLSFLFGFGFNKLLNNITKLNNLLKKQNLNLEELIKERTKEAEEANAAKSIFLSNMSHDIRTPMNVILGLTEVLQETDLPSESKQHVHVIHSAGNVLVELINNILDISKIEAKKLTFDTCDFNLKLFTNEIIDLFQHIASEKKLDLNHELSNEIPSLIIGDPVKLKRVLINLLSNALKFTKDGSIKLIVDKDPEQDGYIKFSIIDSGIGIEEDKIEKIFEIFSQAEISTVKEYGGSGLGLAISKQLVEIMGGKLLIDSTIGKGTTAHFSIKVQEVTKESSDEISLSDNSKTSQLKELPRKLRILLVDDSEDNRLLIKVFLKSTPHEIEFAINGLSAINKFKENKFDLILMDMQMPIVDGYEATETIRKWETTNGLEETPIIALTAYALSGDSNNCLSAGCNLYLSKPISKVKLLDIINKYSRC